MSILTFILFVIIAPIVIVGNHIGTNQAIIEQRELEKEQFENIRKMTQQNCEDYLRKQKKRIWC